MTFTWALTGAGWADCIVADERSQAEATASYIGDAPQCLLTAVARLILGEPEIRAQFEAEPTAFRWIFYREGEDVWIRLLELANHSKHDNAGTEIWSSWQTIDTLARAIIRGFDAVAHQHGESGYQGKWRQPFPRTELEALRRAWRDHAARRPIATPPNLRHLGTALHTFARTCALCRTTRSRLSQHCSSLLFPLAPGRAVPRRGDQAPYIPVRRCTAGPPGRSGRWSWSAASRRRPRPAR